MTQDAVLVLFIQGITCLADLGSLPCGINFHRQALQLITNMALELAKQASINFVMCMTSDCKN